MLVSIISTVFLGSVPFKTFLLENAISTERTIESVEPVKTWKMAAPEPV